MQTESCAASDHGRFALIQKIIALSGPMPDVAAHKGWLWSLGDDALRGRADQLERESGRRAASSPPNWRQLAADRARSSPLKSQI